MRCCQRSTPSTSRIAGGRYLMVNAAGAANLGYAPDQLVGKTDSEIFSGQLGERLWRSDLISRSCRPGRRERSRSR